MPTKERKQPKQIRSLVRRMKAIHDAGLTTEEAVERLKLLAAGFSVSVLKNYGKAICSRDR